MAYCTTADLMLGALATTIPPSIDKEVFVSMAAEHMDARLGPRYKVPVRPFPPATELPYAERVLLKSINAKMATGRIILTITYPNDEGRLNAYGQRLLAESDLELAAIANGDVLIKAPGPDVITVGPQPDDPELADPLARIPGVLNRDAFSAVTAFETNIMQGADVAWAPNEGVRYGRFPRRQSGG